MEASTKKQFSLRPSVDLHKRISLAAQWRGQSLNAFVLASAAKEADEILANRESILLHQEDAEILLKELDKKPEANEGLLEAKAIHAEISGGNHV